ncbi:1256_t:CDS:2 [Ambispora gerdemannii]|uniref:1256_t:CDS:1 n=1 Tax=Ambispora gerdemannii TaxID=144530 RepID=A0A9N8WGX6_9GLOM|nr:1256_t:CDS:2 [Ambispora gerdemannii]
MKLKQYVVEPPLEGETLSEDQVDSEKQVYLDVAEDSKDSDAAAKKKFATTSSSSKLASKKESSSEEDTDVDDEDTKRPKKKKEIMIQINKYSDGDNDLTRLKLNKSKKSWIFI